MDMFECEKNAEALEDLSNTDNPFDNFATGLKITDNKIVVSQHISQVAKH